MIQSFTHTDLVRISHLQPDGWQDIGPFFRFYLEASYCRPFKIEDGQEVVALGAVILHAKTAWLSHIIVAPRTRRRGKGLAMTRRLIDEAEDHGRKTQFLIATQMGQPLYESLGFEVSCEYFCYQAPELCEVGPHPAVRQLVMADAPAILALDREASGEERAGLLSSQVTSGWVFAGADTIDGFCLPTLGEGLVVARSPEAGIALMQMRFVTTDVMPTLPSVNGAANDFLREQGLAHKRTLARMVRNGDDPLQQHMLFNRIGGHVG